MSNRAEWSIGMETEQISYDSFGEAPNDSVGHEVRVRRGRIPTK